MDWNYNVDGPVSGELVLLTVASAEGARQVIPARKIACGPADLAPYYWRAGDPEVQEFLRYGKVVAWQPLPRPA